jgi:membrane protein implicated in regulation of membrane protease activity
LARAAAAGDAIFFNFYVFSLVLGAILLGASLFGGGDHDTDAPDGELDAHADGDGGHQLAEHGHAHGDLGGVLFLFLSLRFWTFFAAGFGLSGLVIDLLGLAPALVSLCVALGMGLAVGLGAAAAFRVFSQQELGSVAGSHDYIGLSARVLLPFGKGQTGKVRLELKGTTVDVLASTDEQIPFAANEAALVVEMQGTTAFVTRIAPSRELEGEA